MSKVVKSVGRAISKVVKGAVNAVKKVGKSKFGKVLIAAAGVYFGGAALSGMMQGASAGSGFLGTISSGLQGAVQGIGNAWSSLGTAATQALGGNFANAGTAISSGFQGGTASMVDGALVTQPMSFAGAPATPLASPAAPTNSPSWMVNSGLAKAPPQVSIPGLNVPPVAPPTNPGLIAGMMSSPYAAPAAIMGGSQLIGGVMQGYGAQKQQERQEQLHAEAQNRYSTNVGTRLWA